ncbi:arylsulfotransferase family protein [Halegenticoccus tardaugens]|uniref:arylsulfotransferase family protein n=1 Tax=Halegenticoccus tardaugens TaxID=2071624 RepID=UPI00100B76C8|nr:arylsulfotransferase family protein [Halegenticoccus tardaugens]
MISAPTLTRTGLRVAFLAVLLVSGATLVYGASTGLSTATAEDVPRAEPRGGHTVVTESAKYGTIIAYEPDGTLQYYNNSHTKYFDVDPVPGDRMTVEYTATDTLHGKSARCTDPPCARNVIERANLSTGETDVVYARYDHRETAGEWHDADRVDDERVLVADIVEDQVLMVNTETEVIEWAWDAQSDFPVEGGGPYPGDWAHVNDVELLDDGRVMVSLRNQDQVVFLDRETGMQEGWTLGSEDDYDTMYEQHNPDYIPEERGGPAVVVADSENARVQEFQRVDGEWVRTWEWSDARMQWPRDADRLPNGNTLIADTNGKRVLEVNPAGEVVWEVPVSHPYDVERLETGDESASGESARKLGLESQTAADGGERRDGGGPGVFALFVRLAKLIVPPRVANAIVYVAPTWMGRPEFAAVGVAVLTGIAWAALELRWRGFDRGIGLQSPFYRKDE